MLPFFNAIGIARCTRRGRGSESDACASGPLPSRCALTVVLCTEITYLLTVYASVRTERDGRRCAITVTLGLTLGDWRRVGAAPSTLRCVMYDVICARAVRSDSSTAHAATASSTGDVAGRGPHTARHAVGQCRRQQRVATRLERRERRSGRSHRAAQAQHVSSVERAGKRLVCRVVSGEIVCRHKMSRVVAYDRLLMGRLGCSGSPRPCTLLGHARIQ